MPDKLKTEIEVAKEELLLAITKLENLLANSIILQSKSIEGMRAQNSAEHGTLFAKMTYITQGVDWIKARWERFTRNP